MGKALRVHIAKARPNNAYVAVQHRENRFYIDEKDQATKRFFRLLGDLLHVTIAESAASSSVVPVLTVPASH